MLQSKHFCASILGEGQKARLTTYSEGSAHDAFYAYGGILSKPHHSFVNCE